MAIYVKHWRWWGLVVCYNRTWLVSHCKGLYFFSLFFYVISL